MTSLKICVYTVLILALTSERVQKVLIFSFINSYTVNIANTVKFQLDLKNNDRDIGN